tara:strand:+ start:35 stop:985 length:951 start_codon:yes stop_codon:yes gene_type:complete
VASIFSEPKSYTVVFSTVIAIFEIINVLGLMDDVVIALNNYDLFPEIPIIESKEKLILLPSSIAMATNIFSNRIIWGDLKLGHQDYIIIIYLLSTLFRLWINNPSRKLKIENYRKKPKMISIKSRRWFLLSFFIIIFTTLFIVNKLGRLAKIYERTGFATFPEGAKLNLWADPKWIEPLPNLGLFDYFSLLLIFLFLIYCLKQSFIIRLAKKTKQDKLSAIERVWKNTDDAISIGLSKPNKSFPIVNDAFSKLLDLLSVSATMNIAATALEDGDVKTSFDRWSLLTAPEGKESEKWEGLSNSLSDIGNFEVEGEEE